MRPLSRALSALAPQLPEAQQAMVLAERLAEAAQEEVGTPDHPPVSLSIGVVSCPDHGDEGETLLDVADRAMYRAKASGDRVALAERDETQVAEEANPR